MVGKLEIEASKSKRGRTLFAALMKELHCRGVVPVKGDLKNEMRRVVADKMNSEAEGDSQGVVSWARNAVDKLA